MHAYAIDLIWCAIDRTSLLLSSFATEEATDPAIDLVIDCTSLLLSSFATEEATDATINPELDSVIDRTGVTLDRTKA